MTDRHPARARDVQADRVGHGVRVADELEVDQPGVGGPGRTDEDVVGLRVTVRQAVRARVADILIGESGGYAIR